MSDCDLRVGAMLCARAPSCAGGSGDCGLAGEMNGKMMAAATLASGRRPVALNCRVRSACCTRRCRHHSLQLRRGIGRIRRSEPLLDLQQAVRAWPLNPI